MSHTHGRLPYLFRQVTSGMATASEKAEFMQQMADPVNAGLAAELIEKHWDKSEHGSSPFTADESRLMLHRVLQADAHQNASYETRPRNLRRWVAAAALVLATAGVGYYLSLSPQPADTAVEVAVADIAPGADKATLTLSNGHTISLDEAPVGILVDEPGFEVKKSENGMLIYAASNGAGQAAGGIPSHTVSTPKGGKYQVVLPDGSRVWLNAASSLRYPARFSDAERIVELTGEAYFEINKVQSENGRIPFRVLTGGQVVDVLGTHFNINSYSDEETSKTTLLEGSIQVSKAGQRTTLILEPGQQCVPAPGGGFRVIKGVDVQEAIAWKDNQFVFNGLTIQSTMRQLCRWYDVEVMYEGRIPNEHLTGYVSRDVPLSRALQMLERISDLKFRVNGRVVTVSDSESK